ncbi:ATP-binding protein [Catenuloplanes niger JCM 9533]
MSALPIRSVADRLRLAHRATFLGRQPEITAFHELLRPDGPHALLVVEGPAGIGKTALLARFADEARAAGRPVLRVDGRDGDEERAGAAGPGAPVVLVDDADRIPALEAWLRDRLLPRLPMDARVVLAARRSPVTRWSADPGWFQAIRPLSLGPLSRMDSSSLLHRFGVAPHLRREMIAFAGGNPSALALAARTAQSPTRDGDGWVPTQELLDRVVAACAGPFPSATHRRALQAAAHSIVITEDLLRAVVGDEAAAMFEWLRTQSFMHVSPFGLVPNGTVRASVEAQLARRDPDGHRALHDRIRDYLFERARIAAGDAVMPAMVMLGYLHRRFGATAFYDAILGMPTGAPDDATAELTTSGVYEDRVDPAELPALLALSDEPELVEFWFGRQPSAFRAYRREAPIPLLDTARVGPFHPLEPRAGRGELIGFSALLRLGVEDLAECEHDPVLAAAWAFTHTAAPLAAGEELDVLRFVARPAAGPPAAQRPAGERLADPLERRRADAVQDLAVYRVLGRAVRPDHPAWTFLATGDPALWTGALRYFDMPGTGLAVPSGGRDRHLFAHDWRAAPPEEWLAGNSRRPVEELPPRADTGLAVLTRAEFDTEVRAALRAWRRPERLAESPLLRTGLVRDADDPVESLRRTLAGAVEALGRHGRTAKQHRVLTTTFLSGAPTQEAAARRLGLPFSTYRRHLTIGLTTICDRLWLGEE